MEKSKDTLILTLANMLASRQVDSNIVLECLKLICEQFSFDGGLVYEIDQYNYLNLKERYILHERPLCQHFPVKQEHSECYDAFVEKTLSFINEDEQNDPFETELLKNLFSSSLLIFPIVDEDMLINGLIIFSNTIPPKNLTDIALETLERLLSMFGSYMRIRIYQNKLAFVKSSLESILDNTGIDIYVNDFYTHEILYVNKSMAAPYGGPSQFFGNKCWEVLFPEQSGPCEFCPQKKLIDENGEPTKVYSWDYQRSFDGSWFRVFSAAFRWMDGRLAHVVSSADITENKRSQATIEYMANYDPLTNLPNRRMLVSECERRINNATKAESGYILFFDIDGFKAINDNYGHDAGDEFLIKLGEFFLSIPMLKDSIYRNGGDEFVAVIGSETISKTNIKSLVSFIHKRFEEPWRLKTGDVFCNTSVGVACYPEDGTTAEKLLYKADQAMYQVKKSGGGNVLFGYELQ